ncbi:MAG: hypothetical protein KC619_01580 [Myxococcales bacterium]|nr:hypothetical protein [Myxococcales bacterium]
MFHRSLMALHPRPGTLLTALVDRPGWPWVEEAARALLDAIDDTTG